MKKLLAAFAVAMAFSAPAMAADFAYKNTTIAEADYSALMSAMQSYGNESAADRTSRLTKELIDIMEAGDAYNNRWHKIIYVANKEGWGTELQTVIDGMNLNTNLADLWNQVEAWQEFYSFIDTNGLDAFTMPERSAIQSDIDAAWNAQDSSFLTTMESAYKEGFSDGYEVGYMDGWNDAMNAVEAAYPN